MKKAWFLSMLIFFGKVHAYDGMTSQIPHAVGGALAAGLLSKVFEESEHRALIGFSVSTALIVLAEGSQLGTGSRRNSQLLDIAYHTLGSAIGAWATDKFILTPIVIPRGLGVAYIQKF